jgi:hypothetical protein
VVDAETDIRVGDALTPRVEVGVLVPVIVCGGVGVGVCVVVGLNAEVGLGVYGGDGEPVGVAVGLVVVDVGL